MRLKDDYEYQRGIARNEYALVTRYFPYASIKRYRYANLLGATHSEDDLGRESVLVVAVGAL
jgi:hypothetical protein